LPGHRLLLVGQGAKAVALAGRGAVLGTALAAGVLVPLRLLLGDPVDLADRFRPWTAAFLVGLLIALVAAEGLARKSLPRMSRAAFVQCLAGLLGIATLRGALPMAPDMILFPLFSGLFGLPSLLLGLLGPPSRIPEQRFERLRRLSRIDAQAALRGTLAGAAVSWVPGLSGGAAATLASIGTSRRTGPSQFMVVLGAVSASTTLLSVAVLFMIHRARSGVAAAARDLIVDFSPWTEALSIPVSLLLLTTSSVLATAVAAPLAARLARRVARRWSRSDPRRIAVASLAAILCLLVVATGPVGLAVAGIATLLGFVPIALRVRRIHLMASLLVPVVLSFVLAAS
ncbi:MAG: tripartite tricarboxylate transporter permease, partial [Thermoplasmata archaeon]